MPETFKITHRYAWNVLIELPAHGKYAAGGRADLRGETHAAGPMSEAGIKYLIARDVAADKGCDIDGIAFIQFTYTELSTA